jgi:hypothetical protein
MLSFEREQPHEILALAEFPISHYLSAKPQKKLSAHNFARSAADAPIKPDPPYRTTFDHKI